MINRIYIAGLLGILFISTAPAAPLSPADRDTVRQRQEQLLQQNQQQRDELERAVVLPRTGTLPTPGQDGGPCFTIHTITLPGATLISPAQQQALTAPWRDQCLNMARLTALVSAVSDWYISRGYITSRAFLTAQDLSRGELRIVVMEGRLRAIRLDGKTPLMLKMAFPGLDGKVLNLRDIEQGMEQVNRLRTTPVQIDILPDSEPGWSVVNLTATPEFPLSASLGMDNSGQRSTGIAQLNGTLTGNNLLGIADKWTVNGGRSSDFATAFDAQNVQAGLSIPWGYSLLDYSWSHSSYRTTLNNSGFDWVSTGDTDTHRLMFSRVMFRNGQIKTGLSAGVTKYTERNWLNDAPLSVNSRSLTSLNLGISHTQKLLGGVATLNPGFSRGMPWLGAASDHDAAADAPRAEFRKWSLSASFQRPLTRDLWWLSSLYGQWSPDRLWSSERLTLGGDSSVRGFKEQYLTGDRGLYWRNELSYPLFSLPLAGQVSATLAVDGGWLAQDRDEGTPAATLWGAAAGLSTAARYWSSQLSVGTPLHWPAGLAPDAVVVNWRVTLMY